MSRLFVVPTPIGNLKDITLRALEVLRDVRFVIAEDTRTSGFLLRHYGIEKPLVAYHQHNEHRIAGSMARRIASEGPAALVSDAGTPGISDAGYLLVNACIKEGVEVECLPGPTALIPALVQSGFPCHAFVFAGFVPHAKGRQNFWEGLREETRTVVCYESPHRLTRAADEIVKILGPQRKVCILRELTKKFMETWRGTAAELQARLSAEKLRGEIVLVIHGKE
ncbi:MAG: 16S rRNA (cytidine(1402)-2'-O)-methyltransferase [Flavobacteriales bacterium]|nr:16S rRNA (cytidine(1402)-2'-O)-methyltransferase [Flavobacteriales bacterium]MCX7767412.1 16S rRNA (cytidine(1402)-2'-O)-methyltransferase [Flavobacteriales bacterium]MDW8410172.1 16S rRNA (cytidine(1402)-2'-O)-methyltransferase [Flavobacteriales bacterium]